MSLLQHKINTVIPINDRDFKHFRSLFTTRRLHKRQYFLHQDDVSQYQAFVEKGLLRSYTIDPKGAEHVLQFASEGWWAADLSAYLTGEPSFLNIDALEDTELLLLSKAHWEQAMKDIPSLERYFRIILQNHLVATQKRLLQSLSETAEEKYKRFLQTYPDCVNRLSQQQIASYLGITRETLNRIRKQPTERS